MTTKWAHLLNAAHIDRVLASSKANPTHWNSRAWGTTEWSAAWDAAWHDMNIRHRQAAWDASWAEWDASWFFALPAGRQAARDAILALIAYDDCAYMLESDPGELAILAKFGDNRAMLLLPACKAFHSIKESA